MGDNWDDSDDEWDVEDDDEIDARLGLKKKEEENKFEDEVDLAVVEKEQAEKARQAELKKKGTALLAKQRAEKEKAEELEFARKAMELEADQEARMSADELRAFKRKQVEEADNALVDDLFGGVENSINQNKEAAAAAAATSDKLVLKDAVAHMKHARRVAEAMKSHGKIHWAKTLIEELVKESSDVLDADALADIVKTCNIMKNEKVQAAKRKQKGQAQKAQAKRDKEAEKKAREKQAQIFGDSNQYDDIDEYGADYEDAFF